MKAGGCGKSEPPAFGVDAGALPAPPPPLSVQERFERALYMMHRHNITAVYSDGRLVVSR